MLSALSLLHNKGLVHCDVSAENLVWSDNVGSSVVLIDLDMACIENAAMHDRRLMASDAATLDTHGCYGKASDVHEAGKLLKKLAAGQPWQVSAEVFCDALISKRLTASGALGHVYLVSSVCMDLSLVSACHRHVNASPGSPNKRLFKPTAPCNNKGRIQAYT